jgi:hypothetical protein
MAIELPGACHGAVDVHIELELTTTAMPIDINDFAISGIDDDVTATVTHNIQNVPSTLDSNL